MKNLLILLAFCSLIFAGVAVAAPATLLKMPDNGREIRVKAGEVIELALKEQAGTGYIWEFHHLNHKYFKVLHTETRPLGDRARLGGPRLHVWRLMTLTPGAAMLSLDYLRPWEGRARAVKHFQVRVNIQ